MAYGLVRRWLVVGAVVVAVPYACLSSSTDGAVGGGDAGVEAGPDALVCEAIREQASADMTAAIKAARAADAGCATEADCTSAELGSCPTDCAFFFAGSPAQVAVINAEEAHQIGTLCPAFLDAGCIAPPPCPGPPAPDVTCIAGECRLRYNTSWISFEFVEPTTDRIAEYDASVTGTDPARSSTLSRDDYDVADRILADASFTDHPTLGCGAPPDDAGAITFRSKLWWMVNGSTTVDATGCVLGDSGNDIKTLYGVISKY